MGITANAPVETPNNVAAKDTSGFANQEAFEAQMTKFQQVQGELEGKNLQFRYVEVDQRTNSEGTGRNMANFQQVQGELEGKNLQFRKLEVD